MPDLIIIIAQRVTASVAAIMLLAACSSQPPPDAALTQCRFEMMKAYGQSYERAGGEDIGRFLGTCMSTKGYELDPSPIDACAGMDWYGRAMFPKCYRGANWLSRYLDDEDARRRGVKKQGD